MYESLRVCVCVCACVTAGLSFVLQSVCVCVCVCGSVNACHKCEWCQSGACVTILFVLQCVCVLHCVCVCCSVCVCVCVFQSPLRVVLIRSIIAKAVSVGEC